LVIVNIDDPLVATGTSCLRAEPSRYLDDLMAQGRLECGHEVIENLGCGAQFAREAPQGE
jgi:hypothetical protein